MHSKNKLSELIHKLYGYDRVIYIHATELEDASVAIVLILHWIAVQTDSTFQFTSGGFESAVYHVKKKTHSRTHT